MKMKKSILTLFGVLLLGTALPIMAQQRKGNVRSTAKTVTSIPMVGPAVVDNHLAFLGLSLGESAPQISSKLIAKGMKVDKSFDDGTSNVYLTGTIDGVQSRVMIGVTAEKTVYNLNLYDKKSYRLPQAKSRFNALITKLESIYGKGKYNTNDNDRKIYHIRTAKGLVTLDLYNEDEMDGASDFYCICISFSENF